MGLTAVEVTNRDLMGENSTKGNGDQLPPWQMHTTQWSLVALASQDDSPDAAAALDCLCRTYWYPVYAHVRRQGRSAADAQDLTQGFFARLLAKRRLARADPQRGRFRSFLLTSLNHYLINEWERSRTEPSGHTVELPWTDAEERLLAEPADVLTPDKVYDKRWAVTLLERVMDQLREEYAAAGNLPVFDALKDRVWGDVAAMGYRPASDSLGMSEGALRVATSRMRDRFRSVLREEVANTVEQPSDVDEELRHLITVLRN